MPSVPLWFKACFSPTHRSRRGVPFSIPSRSRPHAAPNALALTSGFLSLPDRLRLSNHADPRKLREPLRRRRVADWSTRGRQVRPAAAPVSRGFDLVADDRVDIVGGIAGPARNLAGLLEVRGHRYRAAATCRLGPFGAGCGAWRPRRSTAGAGTASRARPALGAARSVGHLGAGTCRAGVGLCPWPRCTACGSVCRMIEPAAPGSPGHRALRRR